MMASIFFMPGTTSPELGGAVLAAVYIGVLHGLVGAVVLAVDVRHVHQKALVQQRRRA